jgi:hypothetical protein
VPSHQVLECVDSDHKPLATQLAAGAQHPTGDGGPRTVGRAVVIRTSSYPLVHLSVMCKGQLRSQLHG